MAVATALESVHISRCQVALDFKRRTSFLTLLSASSAFAAVYHEAAFKADIAPILEKSCANCHDPKKAKNGKKK